MTFRKAQDTVYSEVVTCNGLLVAVVRAPISYCRLEGLREREAGYRCTLANLKFRC